MYASSPARIQQKRGIKSRGKKVSTENVSTQCPNLQVENCITWQLLYCPLLTQISKAQRDYLGQVKLTDFAGHILSQVAGKGDHSSQLLCISFNQLQVGTGDTHCQHTYPQEQTVEEMEKFFLQMETTSSTFFVPPYNSQLCSFYSQLFLKSVLVKTQAYTYKISIDLEFVKHKPLWQNQKSVPTRPSYLIAANPAPSKL